MSDCRYVEGSGYFTKAHVLACRDATCRGCVPCEHDDEGRPVRHCTARRSCSGHIGAGELTCARCVGRTRNHIRACVDGGALMLDEAIVQGVDSEAAYLAGPATDVTVWTERRTAMRDHLTTWRAGDRISDREYLHALTAMEADDEHHPYTVLSRWQRTVAAAHGHTVPAKTTVVEAAAYLERHLTALAQDPDFPWQTLAAEVAACSTHLDAVLHDSRAPERGAPCPECSTRDQPGPALVKVYASKVIYVDGEPSVVGDTTGASDTWRCPRNHAHEWTEADYRLRVGDEHLEHADELTVRDLAIRTGVAAGTIRRWANITRHTTTAGTVETPAKLKPSSRSHDGRKLYRVADVEALRDRDTNQEAS